MAGMMIFGMFFMHGMEDTETRGTGNGDKQMQHSDGDHRHMHDGALEKDPVTAEDGKK